MIGMFKDKILFSAVIFCLAVVAMYYDLSKPPAEYLAQEVPVSTAGIVPDVSFVDLEGKEYLLHSLDEPVVLLHFWASWCIICIAEFPDLLEFVQQHNGKVALVSVSIDQEQEKMQRALDRLKKDHPDKLDNKHIYWVWDYDKKMVADQFNVIATPETIVINKERKMLDKFAGETEWLGEKIDALMFQWLLE